MFETPWNFKQIYSNMIAALKWNPPLCNSLLTVFDETWFSKWSLSSAEFFRSCVLINLPKNPRWSPTVPIRQLSFSSWVLLQWRGFFFFLKCCHYSRDSTPCYNKQFIGFCYTSACRRAPTIWPLFKSDRSNLKEFRLVSYDNISKKMTGIFVKKEEKFINQKI